MDIIKRQWELLIEANFASGCGHTLVEDDKEGSMFVDDEQGKPAAQFIFDKINQKIILEKL